jgi:hypothetical protein
MLFLVSIFAAAGGTASPIVVEQCHYQQAAQFAKGLHIVFKNTARVAATSVTFDVGLHGNGTTAVDRGTFAPGVTIEHVLTSPQLAFFQGSDPHHCVVTHVRFADGTWWDISP